MRVRDLTDDDIGRTLWVLGTLTRDWQRVTFEGLNRSPADAAVSAAENGGPPYWLIMKCTPAAGLMQFRTPGGQVFTGLLVRADAEIWPVEVDWGVTESGDIIELGERAA
jgi:hypothetical protein